MSPEFFFFEELSLLLIVLHFKKRMYLLSTAFTFLSGFDFSSSSVCRCWKGHACFRFAWEPLQFSLRGLNKFLGIPKCHFSKYFL